MPNAHALAAVRNSLPLCAIAIWLVGAVIVAAIIALPCVASDFGCCTALEKAL